MRKPLLLTCVMVCASSATAHAVGFRTQMSCASDYYAYCSKHSPGSPEVRKCMRANGPRLSKACINALIADGEVSKAEVERQKEKLAGVKAKPKAAESKPADVAAAKKAQPETKTTDLAQKKTQPEVKKMDLAQKKAQPEAKKTDLAQKKAQPEAKKTELAQKKPAPAEAKASAPKVAAAPQVPKPEAIARANIPAQAVTPEPERQTVSLDQETFEALKNRGPRFIAETDSGEAIAAEPAQAPSEPAPEDGADTSTAWQPQTETEPVAPDAVADAVANEETLPAEPAPADLAEVQDDAGQKAIHYPPGRMSLGRKLSSARNEAEPATSWWDQLVETVTGE